MSARQIVLDTETTGIRVEDGHKLIEIGCVEMVNRKLTGQHYHCYINPEREVEAGAFAVHGISSQFLNDKPIFKVIVKEFMDFVIGAELIIHNAPFDLSFINKELSSINSEWKNINDHCQVIDTLQLARKLHAGQRNTLDALCKRYNVDNSKRELHGALLDAHLLAQVYLAMTGGQGSFFDALTENQAQDSKSITAATMTVQQHKLTVLHANSEELTEHEKYLENLKRNGKCIWSE